MRRSANRLVKLGLAALTFLGAATALAQDYPSKQIRLITSAAPGGLNDLLSRVIAQGLTPQLGQTLFVENRPGAMTMIGNELASRAAPDGYTLLIGAGEMTMLPYLKKSAASFDPLKDLTPVALAVSTYGAFVASPKFPVRTIPELIAYAKSNPGKVRYATNGVGGALHIAMELLQMKAGIQLEHIPYKGTAQVANDTLSGQVDLASMGLSSAVANPS